MDAFLAIHQDQDFVAMNGIIMSVWGRKPAMEGLT
jgi:hypothetical protein